MEITIDYRLDFIFELVCPILLTLLISIWWGHMPVTPRNEAIMEIIVELHVKFI